MGPRWVIFYNNTKRGCGPLEVSEHVFLAHFEAYWGGPVCPTPLYIILVIQRGEKWAKLVVFQLHPRPNWRR